MFFFIDSSLPANFSNEWAGDWNIDKVFPGYLYKSSFATVVLLMSLPDKKVFKLDGLAAKPNQQPPVVTSIINGSN